VIGAGTGRDVAIAAGAIAGVIVVVTQPPIPALARGMRVYVSGGGTDARVVPA
jgi:hypothetical protein